MSHGHVKICHNNEQCHEQYMQKDKKTLNDVTRLICIEIKFKISIRY